jgi:hypothetical protein
MKQGYRFYIGIDTGVTTGLSCWDKQMKRFSTITSMTILEAIDYVRKTNQYNPDALFVRVEDARLRKWIPQQKNEKAERGRREGAGSVKRDAQIWEEFLTSEKIPFELVAPKNNKTKLAGPYFQKLSGWPEKTNSHGRDAAMLVIGL